MRKVVRRANAVFASFVVLVLAVVIASPASAEVNDVSKSNVELAEGASAPLLIFGAQETNLKLDPLDMVGWRETLHKSIFVDYSKPTGSQFNLALNRTGSFRSSLDIYSAYDPQTVSNGDLDLRRSIARDETYRVVSNLLSATRPVAMLKEALAPFTNPIEIYRSADGSITSSYFGRGMAEQGSVARVFSLNVSVSSGHNLNLAMHFYEKVSLLYYDGDRLEITYLAPGKGYRLGLQEVGFNKLLFVCDIAF